MVILDLYQRGGAGTRRESDCEEFEGAIVSCSRGSAKARRRGENMIKLDL